MNDRPPVPSSLVRRQFLAGGLATVGTALFAGACSSEGDTDAAPSSTSTGPTSSTAPPVTDASGPVSCELTPQQIEGPFYLDEDLVRSDITEGKPGVPLTITFTVADVDACRPVADVPVDIWQCDALGVYSGYAGVTPTPTHAEPVNTSTFLRGTQVTDAEGRCRFETIVPGWYQGRAVHIHVKAHPTETTEAITQLYFADEDLDDVFARPPYVGHAGRYVSEREDPIKTAAGGPAPLVLVRRGEGYDATFTLGLRSR